MGYIFLYYLCTKAWSNPIHNMIGRIENKDISNFLRDNNMIKQLILSYKNKYDKLSEKLYKRYLKEDSENASIKKLDAKKLSINIAFIQSSY